jgi:hypothetical protein
MTNEHSFQIGTPPVGSCRGLVECTYVRRTFKPMFLYNQEYPGIKLYCEFIVQVYEANII